MYNVQFGVCNRRRSKHGDISPQPLPLIDSMMRGANQYYNRLVEIENRRRQQCTETMLAMFPEYATAHAALAAANDVVDAAYQAIDAAKIASTSRKYPEELDDAVKAAKTERTKIAAVEKKLRKSYWKLSETTVEARKAVEEIKAKLTEIRKAKGDIEAAKAALATAEDAIGSTLTPFQLRAKEIDAESYAESKIARDESKSLIGWGGYQQVEEAIEAARDDRPGGPLRFKQWREESAISIHIQNKPLTWLTATSGEDRRLVIERIHGKFHRATLRIAEKPARVVVTVPFILHRPIHPLAKIKWAKLFREEIGTHLKYTLQFTVDAPSEEESIPDTGHTVAVNFGWRIKLDRSVRSAYWVGTDGRSGEVLIPEVKLHRLFHPRILQEIRDKRFNASRKALVDFLVTCPSELHRERFKTLPHWRSCEGLRQAYYWWLVNRLSGDEAIVEELRVYADKERHLHDWQDPESDSLIRWRKWYYRNVAKQLRTNYSKLVIANTDWSELSKTTGTSQDDARKYKNAAAVSVLQRYLKERFDSVEVVDAEYSTKHCHQCGEVNDGVGKSLSHKCEGCGAEWDIDDNNCRNLLDKGHLKVIEKVEAARESEREIVA